LTPEQQAHLDLLWELLPKETIDVKNIQVLHGPKHEVWLHQPPTPAPAPTPAPPPADGFDHAWPLGLQANLPERKVRRNGVVADLAANQPKWRLLKVLADNFPRTFSAQDLLRAGWPEATPELSTFYATASKLRKLLRPLGLTVTRGNQGYTLAVQI
jgi:hypothetical protein